MWATTNCIIMSDIYSSGFGVASFIDRTVPVQVQGVNESKVVVATVAQTTLSPSLQVLQAVVTLPVLIRADQTDRDTDDITACDACVDVSLWLLYCNIIII